MSETSVEKPPCAKCGGTGILPVDDVTIRQCVCAYARMMAHHLGPELAMAPKPDKHVLFQRGEPGEKPKVDKTTKNLFIKGYWTDLLPHFKHALVCKGPSFRFRIVTDEQLKTVYVGAQSYAARPKSKRDDMDTYNSIADLIGPDVDLVILRLGFLGHKNVAMPGVLKEALMLRDAHRKATWLVEVPTSIFGPGHLSYSDDVGDYIWDHFEVLNLIRHDPSRANLPAHGIEAPLPKNIVEDLSLDDPLPEPEMTMARFESNPLLDMISSDDGKKKKRNKGWKQRGGGPI